VVTVKSLPGVKSRHRNLDFVVIREQTGVNLIKPVFPVTNQTLFTKESTWNLPFKTFHGRNLFFIVIRLKVCHLHPETWTRKGANL